MKMRRKIILLTLFLLSFSIQQAHARYYDPTMGRFLQEDPVWDTNLYIYTKNSPVTLVDPTGETWTESFGMTGVWIMGTGPKTRIFGPGSNQVNDMMDAPGVQKAIEGFYSKNAGKDIYSLMEYTNVKGSFGLKGLWNAGLDPTEQFVGSYRIDIYPFSTCVDRHCDTQLLVVLTNTTSVKSLFYGLAPDWEKGPGGNDTQYFYWFIPVDEDSLTSE